MYVKGGTIIRVHGVLQLIVLGRFLFESHSSSVFLNVVLKSEWRIDLFRLTPIRLVPVQYLRGLGLELLDVLDLLDLDLPRMLALVFDWCDRAPDSLGRAAAAASSSTRSTTSTTSTTLPLALLDLLVLMEPCGLVTL